MSFLEERHHALQRDVRTRFASLALNPNDETLRASVQTLGLSPYLLPSSHGGIAPKVEVRSLCVIREELAARSPERDAVLGAHGLGTNTVVVGGSPEQQDKWLKGVANGHHLFAFALTEAEAGSDVSALATRAERQGDAYVLRGAKRFISNAGIATHYTVFARTADGDKGVSAFVIDAQQPGFRVSERMSLMGDHPIGELTFEDCRVPASARLGNEGDGLKIALGTLDVFRPTVAAAAVGMARRAVEEAIHHTKQRRQFGAPLAELQGVQFHLAECAMELDASRLLAHRAAAVKDAGKPRIPYEASTAKLFATEAASRIVDRCLQLHGGNGLIRGSVMERLYRDVRALRIYEGTSDVQKLLIARTILTSGLP